MRWMQSNGEKELIRGWVDQSPESLLGLNGQLLYDSTDVVGYNCNRYPSRYDRSGGTVVYLLIITSIYCTELLRDPIATCRPSLGLCPQSLAVWKCKRKQH